MNKYDEQINKAKKHIKGLKHRKILAALKGYYVILASISYRQDISGKYIPTYQYYFNTPEFLHRAKGKSISNVDGTGTIGRVTSYPPYIAESINSETDTRFPSNYDDFLFTKQQAIEYAKKSKCPKLMLDGIEPASECPEYKLF